MIIWIASYPRSGNNFTRGLLERSYDIKTYAIYDEPRQPKIDVEMARNAEEPYLVKTHDLPKDDSPALYLVRDGRDVLVSYARFIHTQKVANNPDMRTRFLLYMSYAREILRYRTGWQKKLTSFPMYSMKFRTSRAGAIIEPEVFRSILHNLIVYNKSFGGWGSNVLAWTEREAPTQVIKFESLIQSSDPLEKVRDALESLGHSFGVSKGKGPGFEELRRRRPDLYRRGKVGSHKDEMPEDLEELFWQYHGHVMEAMGYSR